MFGQLRRNRDRRRLKDPAYDRLFAEDDSGEVVSLDCETTSLDVRKAEILSIGAVRIRGPKILTSQTLELLVRPPAAVSTETVSIHLLRPIDLESGLPIEDAIRRLLDFIGNRPLVGYYLQFDVAMINKFLKPLLGIRLPNRQIEVSSLYYDAKLRSTGTAYLGRHVDLRFDRILEDLDLPRFAQHDAVNDALMAAMVYIKLTGPFRQPGER